MNRLSIIFLLSLIGTCGLSAQDDMYFVPSEEPAELMPEPHEMPSAVYYCGSERDVDEYNRRGSYVQEIDSTGNDIIEFDGGVGVYPDSTEDYACTRKMSRFDDYSWWDPYWAGYTDGRYDYWRWSDPWYYGMWYAYDPWWHGGWYYSRWYYGWYPHYHHYWPVVSYYRPYRGITGTRNHGSVSRGGRFGSRTGFSSARNYRTETSSRANTNRRFRRNQNSTRVNTQPQRPSFNSGGSLRGTRSGGSFSSPRSGGSFGGARSGGRFGGRR